MYGKGLASMLSGERGSNLLEMAVVMPVLILLLAGVADVGRAFRDYIILTGASREGARFGAYFLSQQTLIQDLTVARAGDVGGALTRSNVTVVRIKGTGCDEAIRVTVVHQIGTILGGVIGVNTLTLRSFAEMPVLDPEQSGAGFRGRAIQ